jgi:general secretion pathway protein G
MRKQFEAIRAARKGNKKGFTLIELLIVVLILGILAGVVMFALGTFTSKSAVAACQTDVKTAQTAVAAYYVTNNGAYPTTYADLLPSGATSVNGGPYLHAWPSNAPYYTITLDVIAPIVTASPVPGQVDVISGTNVAPGVPADDPTVCVGA